MFYWLYIGNSKVSNTARDVQTNMTCSRSSQETVHSLSSPIYSTEGELKDRALILKAEKRFKKVNKKRTRGNFSVGWCKVVVVHNGNQTTLKLKIWSWRRVTCLLTRKSGRWIRRLLNVHGESKNFQRNKRAALGNIHWICITDLMILMRCVEILAAAMSCVEILAAGRLGQVVVVQ